jgi:hypothetical protein
MPDENGNPTLEEQLMDYYGMNGNGTEAGVMGADSWDGSGQGAVTNQGDSDPYGWGSDWSGGAPTPPDPGNDPYYNEPWNPYLDGGSGNSWADQGYAGTGEYGSGNSTDGYFSSNIGANSSESMDKSSKPGILSTVLDFLKGSQETNAKAAGLKSDVAKQLSGLGGLGGTIGNLATGGKGQAVGSAIGQGADIYSQISKLFQDSPDQKQKKDATSAFDKMKQSADAIKAGIASGQFSKQTAVGMLQNLLKIAQNAATAGSQNPYMSTQMSEATAYINSILGGAQDTYNTSLGGTVSKFKGFTPQKSTPGSFDAIAKKLGGV